MAHRLSPGTDLIESDIIRENMEDVEVHLSDVVLGTPEEGEVEGAKGKRVALLGPKGEVIGYIPLYAT
jgi:hypothetical protein